MTRAKVRSKDVSRYVSIYVDEYVLPLLIFQFRSRWLPVKQVQFPVKTVQTVDQQTLVHAQGVRG